MCRTLGFKHEGISRKAVYKNGVYHDVYLHAMTIQDYGSKNEKV
jgi:RimJ/RimL family protein N-acetyltransferase